MVFVTDKNGNRLMPTSEYRARRLMKKGRAVVHKYRPFIIRLTDREGGERQPVEYASDTGYVHVGVAVKSEKHSYHELQADLLPDETERHHDQRKTRRARRNRKRYRKPRFDNRRRKDGWLAPSVRHKVDAQVKLYRDILEVCPITDAWFEMGKFDTQALKALAEGRPLPEGTDYQRGERYGIETLRAAVFERDKHTCVFCGRGLGEASHPQGVPGEAIQHRQVQLEDHAYLHMHHVGFWKGDRSDRLSNLATCCELCHTPENHQPGGKLYGQEPKLPSMAAATFMTMIRWQMLDELKETDPSVRVHVTYGAATKVTRDILRLEKSPVNDAYCTGKFRPRHRTPSLHIKKVRRNDRCLQKFYDAVYIDARDGSGKKGRDLTNGRISRNHKKDSGNLHCYRARKVKKGYTSIRRQRTELKPGSLVEFNGAVKAVHGTHTRFRKLKNGVVVKRVNVQFSNPDPGGPKSAALSKCTVVARNYNTGWARAAD